MKRYAIPALGGVLVFGVVTGFAATMDITSTELGAGDDVVSSCNDTADISYTTDWDATLQAYRVDTATLATGNALCVGQAFKITFTNTVSGVTTEVAELSGTLDGSGNATPTVLDVGGDPLAADLVTGVSVVVTG